MPTRTKTKRASAPKLNAAEQQAEATRKMLRRSVARAKEIQRLTKQLTRENDKAQGALLALANHIADSADTDTLSNRLSDTERAE